MDLNIYTMLYQQKSSQKIYFYFLCLQEEDEEEEEVASDQSLKEFEGATLRYASINLKYALSVLSY